MTHEHAAVRASEESAKHATAGDKASWLSLFAEDAFLQDPVGTSPLDPEGRGYSGKKDIERFWDHVIARAKLKIVASQRIACANTCAAVLQVTNDMGDGKHTVVDMVGIYEVDDQGKLSSLKVYWDWNQLVSQLQDLAVI